jgi:hypothetical protein
VRDSHTRYQQILSIAPMLSQFKEYIVEHRQLKNKKSKGMVRRFIDFISTNNNSSKHSISTSVALSMDDEVHCEVQTKKSGDFEKLTQMTYKRTLPTIIECKQQPTNFVSYPINSFEEHVIGLSPEKEIT